VDVEFRLTLEDDRRSRQRRGRFSLGVAALALVLLLRTPGTGLTGQLAILPVQMDFGDIVVGQTSLAHTAVAASPLRPVRIESIRIEGSDQTAFAVREHCTATLVGGAGCALGLSFRPQRTGNYSAIVQVVEAGGRSVGVALSGRGVSPKKILVHVGVEGGGHVRLFPHKACPGTCDDSFEAGSAVRLLAEPDPGWHFQTWSGAPCALDAECRFTAQHETDLVAIFAREEHTLTITFPHQAHCDAPPGGEVRLSPGTHSCKLVPGVAAPAQGCTFKFRHGEIAQLDGVAPITKLVGSCAGGPTCSLAMTHDAHVEALRCQMN